MAPAGKAKSGNRTPNRTRDRQQQFFEPGKVGRKTGITLKDTGIRDEYGLEPVSGIFSSPPTNSASRTLRSSGMRVQESPGPEVQEVLKSRGKTPRLPPPRSATPKHTNLGSPKRMSSAHRRRTLAERRDEAESPQVTRDTLPPNRKLDFGAHKSVASPSPFKPKKNLRRSTVAVHQDPFTIPDENDSPVLKREDDVEEEPFMPPPDLDDSQLDQIVHDASLDGVEAGSSLLDNSPSRPRHTPRSSRASLAASVVDTGKTAKSSRSKRDSTVLDDVADDVSISIETEDVTRPAKRSKHSIGQSMLRQDDHDESLIDQQQPTIDPSILGTQDQPLQIDDDDDEEFAEDSSDDEPQPEVEVEPQLIQEPESELEPEPSVPSKGKKEKKARLASQPKRSTAKSQTSSQSPRKARAKSEGPVSNVLLRSTTPFEDAEGRTSRYGRTLNQPLKYWANESRIWKHGEIQGIVRADEVVKPSNGRRKKNTKRKRAGGSRLEDIEEESVNESVLPDDWEENLGVIAGLVARYDPTTEGGDMANPVREDLAFAASSIVTRDVLDGDFKYAKMVTLPFFGCGVVELPPNGFKKAKSSKKMQMVFFVHEGKVLVEVGAKDMEINQFNVSKGGVWVVPRGNFYAISNESRTTTARIFFAQGCETDMRAKLGESTQDRTQ